MRNFSISLVALVALAACGPTEYLIRGTPTMPGVDGAIKVEDARGTNRLVTVDLQHLPPPARMADSHEHYGVWFRDGRGRSTYAGHLAYDADDRTGHLVATTPLHRFDVVVTIERREHPEGPSDRLVIRQRVD